MRQEQLRTLPGDGFCGTCTDALAAIDAFHVSDVPYVHLTTVDAKSAIGTARGIYLDTDKGDSVEQAVKRTEGAKEAAEQTENENARYENRHHKKKLPGEQRTEHTEIALVDAVGKQTHGALKRSCGTDVLAKSGKRKVSEGICDG